MMRIAIFLTVLLVSNIVEAQCATCVGEQCFSMASIIYNVPEVVYQKPAQMRVVQKLLNTPEGVRKDILVSLEKSKKIMVPIIGGKAPTVTIQRENGIEYHVFDYKLRLDWRGHTNWILDDDAKENQPVEPTPTIAENKAPLTYPEVPEPVKVKEGGIQSLLRRPSEIKAAPQSKNYETFKN